MGLLFFQSSVVLLVITIILASENGKLKNEISKLKNRNKYNYCPKCGHQLNGKEQHINNQQPVVKNNNVTSTINKEVKNKTHMSDDEVKNNIILITGSILIILAAVIYLTSSWSTSSNILKCAVIFVMFFVFIISSYIAKEKLKLTQTARAFNYIALAYLPLSLISLSIFGLLGDNFSIYGTYQNLYFSIILFICSIIYFFESKKTKDMFLSISKIISAVLGIIFLSIFLSNSFMILIMLLYLYSYFLALLYEAKQFIYSEKFTKIVLIVLFYTLLGFTGLISLYNIFIPNLLLSETIQNIVIILMNLSLSIYLGNKSLNKYLIPISIVFISNFIRIIGNTPDYIQEIIVLLSIPIIYLYNYITEKKINITNFVLCSIVVLIIFTISSLEISFEVIPDYIISLLYVILLGITYLISKNLRKACIWMLPIFIEFTAITIVVDKSLSCNILIGITTLLILLSLVPKLNNKSKELVIIPSILNVIYVLINYQEKSLITFLLVVISIIAYYLLFIKVNKAYKYPLYLFINIGMIYLGHILCNGLNAYTMALSIIIIIALEVMDERLKDTGNFIFILIDYIITALALTIVDKRTAFIMTIVISLVLAAYFLDNKKKITLFSIPLLTPLLYISNSSVMTFGNFNYMILIAVLIIVSVPLLLIKDKKYIVISYVPYIYLLMQSDMDISLYLPIILSLCISIIYYIYSNKKIIFKVLILLSSLLLYYKIIYDLKLTITIFTIGILIIYSLIITRDLMRNQGEDKKIIEYILLIVLNLLAITNYNSEVDGMFFVILLLIITIYSYLKKYGPAFLVSIVFILVNMFLLTRLFWLSLPWWIYILGVGIILILFAIINEINEKDNMKNKLIEFKNNLKL